MHVHNHIQTNTGTGGQAGSERAVGAGSHQAPPAQVVHRATWACDSLPLQTRAHIVRVAGSQTMRGAGIISMTAGAVHASRLQPRRKVLGSASARIEFGSFPKSKLARV